MRARHEVRHARRWRHRGREKPLVALLYDALDHGGVDGVLGAVQGAGRDGVCSVFVSVWTLGMGAESVVGSKG